MRRKSTFEDFEEMFRDDSSDSEDCGEKKELEFDPRIVRNVRRPRIPANGSELFEEHIIGIRTGFEKVVEGLSKVKDLSDEQNMKLQETKEKIKELNSLL